jgi:3-methyl-2-oxobutanoate hydroxymethyltransferase
VLGHARDRQPHTKIHRNAAVEYERLQREHIAAFGEFIADVQADACPALHHAVQWRA